MSIPSNKLDMSLDEIIKISKTEKRKQVRKAKIQGSRGGAVARGQNILKGQGRSRGGVGGSRGRGNAAVRQTLILNQQRGTNLQRGKRGQGRGRGSGINQQNSNISPLHRNTVNQQQNARGTGTGRGRGTARRRGRGRGLQRNQIIFTNSQRSPTPQQFTVSLQDATQRQRLDSTRQQAALLKEKQLALKNLQQAQKNIQTVNLALQKSSRDKVVNQARGINNYLSQQSVGQGRRKLLAGLRKQSYGTNNYTPVRQLSNTSVTITNPTAVNSSLKQIGKRRRWRRNKNNNVPSEHFTIQVGNQSTQPIRQPQSSVLEQIKMLKPAVSTTYKFQKNVFAAPATGVSLSDRFSGSAFVGGGDGILEERKVFV